MVVGSIAIQRANKKNNIMTLEEIKTAVDAGKTVCWQNGHYKVVKSNFDYIIKCGNGSCISLTWANGVTMNGKEDDFFIEKTIIQ